VISAATPIPDPPDEPDDDRPTVLPPFDADAFARDSELSLQAVTAPKGETTMDAARRLLADEKPEEALFLLARLLEQMPLDSEASRLSSECRAALERECWLVIDSPAAILDVSLSPEELRGFGLDHVSGFLLSLMDGGTDVETLLDLCGLPRLLALRHLRGLVVRGIVVPRRRAPPQ
jgi:hypothetical protein